MSSRVSAANATYCYLDIDIDNYRAKLGRAAAFVNATDSRYGFSSPDLLSLGGSELSRIPDLLETDHEWSSSSTDVKIRPPVQGNRIVVRLYWDVAPMACENFATLCSNGQRLPEAAANAKVDPAPIGDSGKPLTYKGCSIHRVVPGFVVQGGDIVKGNGSGGESIFSKKFKDERPGLAMKHDRRGILSMGNSGKNSNTSQFFFTFAATPACDAKHVIFGEVVSGWEVLGALEKVGSSNGEPLVPITVTECGVWKHLVTPGAGYWFDRPDPEAYSGISPVFVVWPRVAVVAPNEAALTRFASVLEAHCSIFKIVGNDDEDAESTIKRLQGLLDTCSVDIVLLAPVYKESREQLRIPQDKWEGRSLEEVVFVSKPVDAANVIASQSWVRQQTSWQIDSPVNT